MRKPALDLSDIVRPRWRSLPAHRSEGKASTATELARPRRAVKLQRRIAARRRRGAWRRKRGPSDHQSYRDARRRRTLSERSSTRFYNS